MSRLLAAAVVFVAALPVLASEPGQPIAVTQTMHVSDWIAAIGTGITALAFVVGAFSLVLEFGWRRRQYALDMMREWSTHTAPHRDAIERTYPGIFNNKHGEVPARLPVSEAERVFCFAKGDDLTAALKRHFIELLNYCEFISVAYSRRIANRAIIQESFKGACVLLHDRLHPYIEVTTRYRDDKNPWTPFCKLADTWSETGIADVHKRG